MRTSAEAGATDAAAVTPEPPGGAHRRIARRVPWAWLVPLAVYLGAWGLTLGAWLLLDAVDVFTGSWRAYFVWKDTVNYLQIAALGYPDRLPVRPDGLVEANNSAFFPLWPLLIHWLAALTGVTHVVAGLILTIVCGAAACLLVWLLAERLRGRATAHRTLLLWGLFPGAQVLGLMYSEMLAIALAVGCLFALLAERWLVAGLLAATATAVRPNMLALCVACAWAALLAVWRRRAWTALLAPALSPLGALAYFAWLGTRYHDYAFWFRTEHDGWQQRTDWGVTTIRRVFWQDPQVSCLPEYNAIFTATFALIVLGLVALAFDRLPGVLNLYALTVLFLSLTASAQGAKPRFLWTAFPLFVAAGSRLRGWWGGVVTVLLAGLFAACFVFVRVWSGLHPGQGAP